MATSPDDLDEQILTLLRSDGRATFAEIGHRIGLSAPAVKRRVDRLVADEVISGFTAVVDPSNLGWATEAYVLVHCKGTVSPQVLKGIWEPIPEVVNASTVTGQADALLHVRARDNQHLEQVLEYVRGDETIDHTESIIVLSRLLRRG